MFFITVLFALLLIYDSSRVVVPTVVQSSIPVSQPKKVKVVVSDAHAVPSEHRVPVVKVAVRIDPTLLYREREFDRMFARSKWPKRFYPEVKLIAFCESKFDPSTRGTTDDHGLLQVHFPDHQTKVSSRVLLYDPVVNLNVGYKVYLEAVHGKFHNGFAPWYDTNHCHGLVPPAVAAEIARFKEEHSNS